MIEREVQFGDARVPLPEGWDDHTEESEGLPTLYRGDGVGALQFTVGSYRGGKAPQPSDEELTGLLESQVRQAGLSSPPEHAMLQHGPMRWVTASLRSKDIFYRLWLGSDGLNLVFATYNVACDSRSTEEEAEVDAIIAGLRFPEPGALRKAS